MKKNIIFAALFLLSGCATRDDGLTGTGVFNNAPKTSALALADADRVDAVQRLYHDGLYDRARQEADRLLADGTRHPQVFMLKAQLMRQAGDLDGAIPWCSKAVEASPLWIEPRVLAAQIHLAKERYAAAGSVFEDIDRLAPKGPWGAYGQGVVAARRGDHDQAIVQCDRALERDPDHVPSLELRAQLARLKGDATGEERLLARYAALLPMDPGARVRLGELAQAAGRVEDARRQLMRAYELEPRPNIAAKLADLARFAGDAEDEHRWRLRSGPSVGQVPDVGDAPKQGVQ